MCSTEDFNDTQSLTEKDEYYHLYGKLLANPSFGEEIVISGIAGVFPNSGDIYELRDNLFNKVDLVGPHSRWDCDHSGLPPRMGTILELDKYDGGFFGVHERQSHSMDAMARIFHEKAVEAILDAGLHPSELEGTKTGVYVGIISSENDQAWYLDNLGSQTFAVTGSQRSMIAHRLSYFLKLRGPSTTLDTGCSSSSFALENAYSAIRSGEIENAIVGGTHLCLHPTITRHLLRLGALSKDGFCKTFDNEANGYVRSEGIVAIFLQKAKHSKRIYARIVHTKTNCDGYKEEGVTFPSKFSQMKLMDDLYGESGVDRFILSFLEVHGTGTKVGDLQECAAIDSVLTRERTTPLLIGSVKTNIGHTEAASSLCSIIKCILAMETGYIPPNIHFKTPNDAIAGLVEGRMKVVTDKTALEDGDALIGVSSFGIGGTNAHVLLRRNAKKKSLSKDGLTRMVCVSGRTEEAVSVLLDQIGCNAMDHEYVKLLHDIFAENIQNHSHRGFIVASPCGEVSKSFAFCPELDKPLYLVIGELKNWFEIGKQLMSLPTFRDSIIRIQVLLRDKEVNISDSFLNNRLFIKDRFPVVGTVAVQVTIIHILELVGIKPNRCYDYSLDKLVSAYYNKFLTLEEIISHAFAMNEAAFSDNGLINDAVKMDVLSGYQCHGVNDIEPNSIILKIGDGSWDEMGVSIISLFAKGRKDYLVEFLTGLGRLYLRGGKPQISKLYPQVNLPVSRGTPMISPYVRWNHTRKKFVPNYSLRLFQQMNTGTTRYKIQITDPQWAFIAAHVIDGRTIFPAAGYLYLVWQAFAVMHRVRLNVTRVSIKDCKFLRVTSVPANGSLVFTVYISTATGDFGLIEENSIVVTGNIAFLQKNAKICNFTPPDILSRNSRMNKKEVYKELRLRGYQYGSELRMIEEYDFTTDRVYVKWQNNWIGFLDNMLQSSILRTNSRHLQVPIFISEVNIAPDVHLEFIRETAKNSTATQPNLAVCYDGNTGKIKCGGVTISGAIGEYMTRRKTIATPVLESYEFIPNFTELSLRESVRVNTQIILENTLARKFKAVEVVDEYLDDDHEPLMPIVKGVLEDEILVQSQVKILSAKTLDVNVEVENKKLEMEADCLLVIASKIISRSETFNSALAALKKNGFVMTREGPCYEVKNDLHPDVIVVTAHRTPSETILLLRKQSQRRDAQYIEINSSEDFTWVPEVQDVFNENSHKDLVLYSQDPTSGIMGMVKCLRDEQGSKNIRCVFVMDEGEKFSPNSNAYDNQLKKNMAFNIYKNGQWGTLRHLLLEEPHAVENEHCLVNIAAKGDLSSLRWIQGALTHRTTPEPEKELICVYYSSLNFKDVMIATGRINANSDPLAQDLPLGYEFSGRNRRGRRVMGCCKKEALSNLVLADRHFIYDVPDEWTMEEAATVSLAYITSIYALVMRGRLRRGESILIHSGTGGVGQAAINLALHYGCEVFTTVGTQEKRNFIKKTYPQLKDENIGNSRDGNFEQMVYRGTNGRGVDLVLNSLTEEKMVASVRCLATNGRFVEIGKFDSVRNTYINTILFKKQASFLGVMLDNIFCNTTKCEIKKIFEEMMRKGAIIPLSKNIFERDEVQKAFRFMASGKHMGKVLIRIRQPEQQLVFLSPVQKMCGLPRYLCNNQNVYIIVGGLGGFGLELADWLVLRGAKKLVLTSRKGVNSGYQRYRIKLWRSYGVIVKISTINVAGREGCEQLIDECLQLGPIAAIFNLAMVIHNAIFENQTPKTFVEAFEPKAFATKHLDDVTRTMCPDLRDFVVFSSFCCGRGYVGQTNYGMANSAMERICERRKREGYAALAIQWGLVGEVGVVAEIQEDLMEMELGGTLEQPISNCLEVLDILLTQRRAPVVSSVVVAQKKREKPPNNIIDAIIEIIGLQDSKYVSHHATLPELGMDSMIAVEVRLVLERDFDVFLSTKDVRAMTLARLKEIQEEQLAARQDADKRQEAEFETKTLFSPSEEDADVGDKHKLPKVILFPDLNGSTGIFRSLLIRLENATIAQYVIDDQTTNVAKTVESLINLVEKSPAIRKSFTFVAYSYGVLIALEVVHVLESRGYCGTLIHIDGAPSLAQRSVQSLNGPSEQLLQTDLTYQSLLGRIPHNETGTLTNQEKLNSIGELTKNVANEGYKELDTYRSPYRDLKSGIKLFKPTSSIVQGVEDDCGLLQFFQKSVEIQYFEGNKETILESENLADAIHAITQLKE